MAQVNPKADDMPNWVRGTTHHEHRDRKLVSSVRPAMTTGMAILMRVIFISDLPFFPADESAKTFSTTWTPYPTPTAMSATGMAVEIMVSGIFARAIMPKVHRQAIPTESRGRSMPLKFLKKKKRHMRRTTVTRGGRKMRSLIM